MTAYKMTEVSGEEVGVLIMRMTNYFSTYNLWLVEADKDLAEAARTNELGTDTAGKPISSTKAKVLTDATEQAYKFNLVKAHVVNIEQIINSLKALQKGVLNEYTHSGL